jgi:sugar phosphate isomerase/epimerase
MREGAIALKLGIIHYNAPGPDLEGFLSYAADTGFTHVELQLPDVWPDGEEDPEARAESVRALVEGKGLGIGALSSGNDFVVLGADEVRFQVERMERICGLARLLGCDTIRTEGGSPKDSVPEGKWVDAIAGCLIPCREFIEPMGIKLAVDNHGWCTNDGDLQLAVFEKVGSPNVGCNLDTMNYRWFGHDLETIDRYYEIMAPYVMHTHLKDGTGSREKYIGAALGDGEIHLMHAVQCARKAGYEGVWCAEWEGSGESAIGYAKCLEWMRANL